MQPKIYSISDHEINPALIDPDAIQVIQHLHNAGFTAYLVGGSVRDLLLKRTPKDYDISTSALPEEVKYVFGRQCLLIGRRFRLAHIRFGHKIIEVSTFRSGEKESELIVRDNQWGSPEEDALRRDFTINGLFYDPTSQSIIDYVGGWTDIHQKILRVIGSSEMRFKQDPVRMLRLLKFRARFGLAVESESKRALISCRQEILKSSPARLLEEMLRMLESGAASPFLNLLHDSGLLVFLFPTLVECWEKEGKTILRTLVAVDRINQSLGKRPLDRSILLAVFLFSFIETEVQAIDSSTPPHLGDVIMMTSMALRRFMTGAFIQFPKRLTAMAASLASMQYRLAPSAGKLRHPARVLRQKDFPLALQLLMIRAMVDKSLVEQYNMWKGMYRQYQQQQHHGYRQT